MTENGRQKAEGMAEDSGQRTADGGQRAEGKGRRAKEEVEEFYIRVLYPTENRTESSVRPPGQSLGGHKDHSAHARPPLPEGFRTGEWLPAATRFVEGLRC